MADMADIQRPDDNRLDSLTLSLGSNAADAIRRVGHAAAILSGRMTVVAMTSIFVTPDIHATLLHPPLVGRPWYANAVACIQLPTPPLSIASIPALNAFLKDLEREMGRHKEHKAIGLVNIDIDLVAAPGRILRPADFLRPYYHPRVLTL